MAIIGHDVLRREILHVRDHPGALSVPYIDLSARFALDNGLDVVIEGILHSESYGEMLTRLRNDHIGVTRCYYYGRGYRSIIAAGSEHQGSTVLPRDATPVTQEKSWRSASRSPESTTFWTASMVTWLVNMLLSVPFQIARTASTSPASTALPADSMAC